MKLQSMVSFVLEQIGNHNHYEPLMELTSIRNYAEFLSQPLTLGMFIPCGEDGLPMEPYIKTESEQISDNLNNCRLFSKEEVAYQQAVNRVLFEGLTAEKRADWYIVLLKESPVWVSWNKSKTVESLIDRELTLTHTAVTQLKK